jgi:hypothetical protein
MKDTPLSRAKECDRMDGRDIRSCHSYGITKSRTDFRFLGAKAVMQALDFPLSRTPRVKVAV